MIVAFEQRTYRVKSFKGNPVTPELMKQYDLDRKRIADAVRDYFPGAIDRDLTMDELMRHRGWMFDVSIAEQKGERPCS